MNFPTGIQSIDNICEVEIIGAASAEHEQPSLFFEVPHGATRASDYTRVRAMLSSDLPDDLIDYFFVNTDVGSTEYAHCVAEMITQASAAERPVSILLLRCLIPRTFIDTNRVIGHETGAAKDARMTPGMAEYIREPADVDLLRRMHREYHGVAQRAYEWVCGAGGLAMAAHTYAPRSIHIDSFDEGIGKALRAAYEPDQYATWPERPAVDLITADPNGRNLAPRGLVESIRDSFGTLGLQVAENGTYQLHPVSMAHRYAARHPHRVLCIEVARDQLADPFSPFEEMNISLERVARISQPLAASFVRELEGRQG